MPRLPKLICATGWISVFRLVLIWICLSPRAGFSAGENSSSSDYCFDIWQTEDGLPYNSVTAVVQTHDRYFWIGTYNGLARFDGARFTVFDSGNRVTSLFEDSESNLWIGHETGELTRFSQGTFKPVPLGETWPGGEIVDINTDDKGDLWLLNKTGWLFRVRDHYSVPVPKDGAPAGERVTSLAREKNGKLWAVQEGMLSVFENGRITPWSIGNEPKTNYLQRACACSDGGLWVVGNGRIRQWTEKKWGKDLGPVPWGPNTAMSMLETKSGELFVGTLEAGLYIISPDGTSRHFSRQNGLPHDWIRYVCQDVEGKLWAGTGGGGLVGLRARTVEMVKVPDEWLGRAVLAVTSSARGGVWVGTEGAGLYRWNGTVAERFLQTNGLWNAFDWSLLEDPQGRLWLGSWGSGLFVRDKDNFEQPTGLDPTGIFTAMYQSKDGTLWLGTAVGLCESKNGKYTWYTRQGSLILKDVRTITEDAAGTIWFGMLGGGLGRLDHGKLSQFRKQDGLPGDSVWSLFPDDDGTLWIGTFGGGLCRLKHGHFATISTKEGLPNNVICHIADDSHGHFWISSYGGIFHVRKSDLDACADGVTKSVFCFTYGKADGLNTLECSGGFQPSGCQTLDGRLWFPTSKGLAVIDPANVRINPVEPRTVIEDVTVDGEAISSPALIASPAGFRLEILPGKQRFDFHYTGLSLVAPEKVRFKYQLENADSDWYEAGPSRVAHYSTLKPGDYTFRVKACNNDGLWDETGATLSLRILPHFWQTWWFTTGAIIAGAGLVGGVARYTTRRRLRQRMEQLERQRAIEKERNRIAKDIHDDLGASLTRITLLSQSGRADHDDPQQAAADLDQIYKTARELTRAMDEIVWAVSPQHDTLDSLVAYLGKFAQDFLSVAGIRCRLDVPIELPAWPLTAEVRHNLFLSLKEVLNNVLKHASATEVRVSLNLTEKGFWLLVDDNGKGFDLARVNSIAAGGPDFGARISTGNGLVNVQKRLKEIGGLFEIKSSPGEGTNVRFWVAVEK